MNNNINKIPIVTKQAIDESFINIASIDINNKTNEEIKDHLDKFNKELLKKQPEIYTFIEKIIEGHNSMTNGIISTQQLAIYIMIIVDSLYIQKEIDHMKNIFNIDDET